MGYRWIEDIEEFRAIADEWDGLVKASGSINPFLLSDFIITWWKYFRNGTKLSIFILHNEDGKIAGGIPLYLKNGDGAYRFARVLSHIGEGVANYTEPLYDESKTLILPQLSAALEDRRDWDALYLPEVRFESPLLSEHGNYTMNGHHTSYIIQDHMNMEIDFSGGKDKLIAGLPRKLRKDLRSRRKHAVKDYGAITFRRIEGPDEVRQLFSLYTDFSLDSFNRRDRKSGFEDKRYRSFFEDFLIILDRKEMLDAYALFAGEKALAIIFGYRFGSAFNWALTAFNYECQHLRPGYLLVEELMNEISRRGGSTCNCYGYDSFYKNQWCNKRTPLYRFFLIRNSVRGFYYKTIQAIERSLRLNRMAVDIARRLKKV